MGEIIDMKSISIYNLVDIGEKGIAIDDIQRAIQKKVIDILNSLVTNAGVTDGIGKIVTFFIVSKLAKTNT